MARLARGLPQKQDGIKIVTSIPSSGDGKAGDIRLLAKSSVEGAVLYVKSGSKWFPFQSGIANPITKLARKPDFDSGWIDVDRQDTDKDNHTIAHGLRLTADGTPRLAQVWLRDTYGSGDSGAYATPTNYLYQHEKFQHGMGNPLTWIGTDIRYSADNIYIQAYSSYYIFHTYQDDSGGVGTHLHWSRMDMKILLWK